jgi:glutamyl-tRNA synthetase
MGKVMQSLRVSITGQAGGPDLMDIIEILGKEEITERIRLALDKLKDQISE